MGYRMSFGCSCEEGHFFFELDDELDPHVVLKAAGVATMPSTGDRSEDADDEDEQADIAPDTFLRWIDSIAAQRLAILEALRRRGGPPSQWSAWREREFADALRSYRELSAHAAEVGAPIDAAWA
jgi:hypothetical protein